MVSVSHFLLVALTAMIGSAAAAPLAPIVQDTPSTLATAVAGPLTADMITKISPKVAPAVAQRVAPSINKSYTKYNIDNANAQAAVLALMMFESGNFAYNHKIFPPTFGVGTYSMLDVNFIKQYAMDLHPSVAQSITDPDAILAIVQNEDDSAGSAAWFLSKKCPTLIPAFATDAAGTWARYIGADCIDGGNDPGRLALFNAALAAFGK